MFCVKTFCVIVLTILTCFTDVKGRAPCPPKCGSSCKYDQNSNIVEAICRDAMLRSLPSTLTKLYVLDARSQYTLPLGKLADFSFGNYTHMTSLKIQNYNISGLYGECFKNIPNLVTLDLSQNVIFAIQEANFQGHTSMKLLDLSQNRIQAIGANSFRALSSLTELRIAQNDLQVLHSHDFTGLTGIIKIDLHTNYISSIDDNTFNFLTTLQEVNLRNNLLTTVGQNLFKNMQSLKVIDLGTNKIQTLNETSLAGTNLVTLNLALNNIKEIPTALLLGVPNDNLTVDLTGNNVTEIRNNAFVGIILRSLSLADNNISLLEPDALHGSTIKTLDLRNNSLQHLPTDLASDIDQSTVLLSENPWSCDCGIQWLKSYLQSTNQEPLCATPPEFAGTKVTEAVFDLCEDSNAKKNKKHRPIWPIILGVLLGALLLAILLAILIRCLCCKQKVAPEPSSKNSSQTSVKKKKSKYCGVESKIAQLWKV